MTAEKSRMSRAELRQIALDVCTPEQIAHLNGAELETDPIENIQDWLALLWRTLALLVFVVGTILSLILWRVW